MGGDGAEGALEEASPASREWRSTGTPEPRDEEGARGRLSSLGASALADLELVMLLLGCTRDHAQHLLVPGLRALAQGEGESVMRSGRRRRDARRLQVAIELGRRSLEAPEARPVLGNALEIFHYVRPRLAALRCEHFLVLCFNTRQVLLREACAARGSTTHCQVDPREVFAPAVAARASAVVLVHNHPSGDPQPSTLDVALTLQLRDAGRPLCIRVLDHLVLGDTGFVSLAHRGLLSEDAHSANLVLPQTHQR